MSSKNVNFGIVFSFYSNETYWSSEKIMMEERVKLHTKFLQENYTNIKQMFGEHTKSVFKDVKNILWAFELQNLMNDTLSKFGKDLNRVSAYLNLK